MSDSRHMVPLTSETCSLPLEPAVEKAVAGFAATLRCTHYRQTPAWAACQRKHAMNVVVSRHAGNIVALSLIEVLPTRLKIAPIQRVAWGPLCADPTMLLQHLDFLVQTCAGDCAALRFGPLPLDFGATPHLPGVPVSDSAFYASTLLAKVEPDATAQWRNLRRSTRTAINKARRSGVVVTAATSESQYREFARRYNDFATERRLAPLDPDVAARIPGAFSRNAVLLLAEVEGESVGNALIMPGAAGPVYEWGWTAQWAREAGLPIMHLILWAALDWCRDSGFTALDLGGLDTQRDNDPINNFKLGFTKDRLDFTGEREIVLSPVRYGITRAIRKLAEGAPERLLNQLLSSR